jgi:hypothetical protein
LEHDLVVLVLNEFDVVLHTKKSADVTEVFVLNLASLKSVTHEALQVLNTGQSVFGQRGSDKCVSLAGRLTAE